MAEKLHRKSNQILRVACKECNGTRGGISSLFQSVHCKQDWNAKKEKTFFKTRHKLNDRMVMFRKRIVESVNGIARKLCLREIDDICNYQTIFR